MCTEQCDTEAAPLNHEPELSKQSDTVSSQFPTDPTECSLIFALLGQCNNIVSFKLILDFLVGYFVRTRTACGHLFFRWFPSVYTCRYVKNTELKTDYFNFIFPQTKQKTVTRFNLETSEANLIQIPAWQ